MLNQTNAPLYVQYGCGFSAPKDWANFDASYTLRWERTPLLGRLYTKNGQRFPAKVLYGDILKGLPVAPHSCKGVYASHVLEHLALDQFHIALDNTKRILCSGGIFRLVVPDLECLARRYINELSDGINAAAENFLRSSVLGKAITKPGLSGYIYRALNTSSHLWMWDSLSMIAALEKHGFVNIRKCQFGDCEDTMFSLVEDEARFLGAVSVEARA